MQIATIVKKKYKKVKKSDNMLEKIKKIELHLHLDGSVRPETIAELKQESVKDIKKEMQVASDCKNLKEYLTKFTLPLEYMQTEKNIKRISKELVEDLEKDNVIYAEIRFAPQLHTKKGLSLEQIVDAVLEGVNSNKNIKINLILCLMRGDSLEKNEEVLKVAKKYLGRGVCAVDLAGSEKEYPNYLYKDLFKKAEELSIPYTIHAGEALGKESVYLALEMNATRIGHGIHLEDDEDLIEKLKRNNILLEICPTSNVQTQAITTINKHPIYNFYQKGLPISINTDNRTVSNTTLTKEYQILAETFPFTIEDFIRINKIAIEHSFLTEEEKQELKKNLNM